MAGGKRKGLSFEEKRQRLLEIYYNLKEPLNLKEIEKLGPKKGIIPQAVKEVNQSLIDDNLVESDKIGIGAFFWALPSQGLQKRKNAIEDYDRKIEQCKKDVAEKTQKIEEATKSRESVDGNREEMLKQLEELKKSKTSLQQELKNYERSDPKQLIKM